METTPAGWKRSSLSGYPICVITHGRQNDRNGEGSGVRKAPAGLAQRFGPAKFGNHVLAGLLAGFGRRRGGGERSGERQSRGSPGRLRRRSESVHHGFVAYGSTTPFDHAFDGGFQQECQPFRIKGGTSFDGLASRPENRAEDGSRGP